MGRIRSRAASSAALDGVPPLFLQGAGELDDEDSILGRQADGREQPDLEIDVARQAAPHGGKDGAQDADRHPQNDGKGHGPALVERGQGQEDHQHRQGIEQRRLGPGGALLEGEAGPLQTDARRQFPDQFLDRRHGLAGTDARAGLTQDLGRGQAVEALQARRAIDPAQRGEGREGHHLALLVAHVPGIQVLRQHAMGGVGLEIDPLDPALVDEIIDIGTAPGDRQSRG